MKACSNTVKPYFPGLVTDLSLDLTPLLIGKNPCGRRLGEHRDQKYRDRPGDHVGLDSHGGTRQCLMVNATGPIGKLSKRSTHPAQSRRTTLRS